MNVAIPTETDQVVGLPKLDGELRREEVHDQPTEIPVAPKHPVKKDEQSRVYILRLEAVSMRRGVGEG